MDGTGMIDPALLVGLGLALMMGVCLLVIISMRDRSWTPPALYTRTLQCQALGRAARVRILEQLHDGVPVRTVQRCSLWVYGRRQCRQECLQGVAAA